MAKKCGLMPPGLGPFVQLTLGCLCLCVLAYKCSIDKSGRGTVRFVFDSSKNFGGAAWMHVANLMVAGMLGRVASSGGDACQWYFIEIMIDTTLGVYIEYKLLQLLLVSLRNWGVGWLADSIEAPCIVIPDEQDAEVGTGGSSDASKAQAEPLLSQKERSLASDLAMLAEHLDKGKYAMQLFSWLGVVTAMKFIMVMIMLALSPQLEAVSGLVLDPLTDPAMKLVVVMILTPAIMNAVQFWLQDNIFVDVAKWHDKKQAAQAQANELGVDAGSFNTALMGYDHDINKELRELESSQAAVLQMLEGSWSNSELQQRVKESFELTGKCQKLKDEKYNTQSAKLKELQYELQRRTDGSFVQDVVRGKAVKRTESMVVDKYSPVFTVNSSQPLPSEYVAVCGDGELGEWDVSKAIPLKTSTSKWPKWESDSIPLDRSKYLHQYNFVILEKKTHEVVRWEDGCRRVLYSGSYPATADFDKPPKL